MSKINDLLFMLEEQLKKEKNERNLRVKELRDVTQYELESQKMHNSGTRILKSRVRQEYVQFLQGEFGRVAAVNGVQAYLQR
jgi:hypothetical protein